MNGRQNGAAEPVLNPLDVFEQEHGRHRELCDSLELIADSLPDQVDSRLCATLASVLRVDLPVHHRSEEEVLFPLLEQRAGADETLAIVLARLRHEHALDEGYAEELGDLLDTLSRDARPANPDMVGYMLRGFFESYRRHVHLEQVVILPYARRRFTDADLRHLADKLGVPGN